MTTSHLLNPDRIYQLPRLLLLALLGTPNRFLVVCLTLLASSFTWSQVTFEREVFISERGLFFDGVDVGANTNVPNNGPAYDYAFGNRITPHGDCIKEFQGYVFMTWYRGGKNDRHVMLSRYNPNTGAVRTIEFPHRHNGFQNVPHIGESHNTIAVGISPLDGTIHLLYDMHSYSEDRPANGSLANDYFRYSYSVKNAATVPDSQFNLSQFVNDSDGDYKHLQMRPGTDYRSLTYPNFFLNTRGELFMWIREGGHTNGAYKFCKYDGNQWSDFTSFNVLNASRNNGVNHNWGLYGDIKFESGKMRIGFARRSGNRNDRFQVNNGFYYGYSDDPNGLNQWKDHNDRPFTLPLFDSERIKASEPSDVLGLSAPNSVVMTSGSNWTVTDNGDIHSVTAVGTGRAKTAVHTYKKAGETVFQTATDFPGGDLYTYKNDVYLIGLGGGRIFVEKAVGGTNNWERIYQSTGTRRFRHGNVYISQEGKLYFYLMERLSGSSQPLYLQILDLGLSQTPDNQLPTVNITSPQNNAVFSVGEEITISATASDTDGSIDRVNFIVNDNFYRSDASAPYSQTFAPETAGTYRFRARAIDNDLGVAEAFVTVTVVETQNQLPEVQLTSPLDGAVFSVGEEITLAATATDEDGSIDRIHFKINDDFYRRDETSPYSQVFTPQNPGTYTLAARAFDNSGGSSEVSISVTVQDAENLLPEVDITAPTEGTVYALGEEITITANATDMDGSIDRVNFKINDNFYRGDATSPYSQTFAPETAGNYKLAVRAFDDDGGFTEVFVTITVEETQNQLPEVVLTAPLEGSTYIVGEEITITANATDPDGTIDRVNFKVNDDFYRSDLTPPYSQTFLPERAGDYRLAVRGFDNDNGSTEVFVTVTVVEAENLLPTVIFTEPLEGAVYTVGGEITMTATATDMDGSIERVNFKVNGAFYRSDVRSPYSQTFAPESAGTYTLAAEALDNDGESTEVFVTVTVVESQNQLPQVIMTAPVEGQVFGLGEEITISATANDPDGSIDRVNFKVNDDFYRSDPIAPYLRTFVPDSASTYKLAVRAFDNDGGSTEIFVNVSVVETDNQLPEVLLTEPREGSVFELGDEIILDAIATDMDGSIDRVHFIVNNELYSNDTSPPYVQTYIPQSTGTYQLTVQAFDNEGGITETTVNFTVVQTENQLPSLAFVSPEDDLVLEENYDQLYILVQASDTDGSLTDVSLYLSDILIRSIDVAPYEWGADTFTNETLGLAVGEHQFRAVATDNHGGVSEAFFNVTVSAMSDSPTQVQEISLYPNPAKNQFSISGAPDEPGIITVYSMDGKAVMSQPIKEGNASYDISNISAGVFLVKLRYRNRIVHLRLISSN